MLTLTSMSLHALRSVEARAYAFWEHEEPAAPERELDPTNTFHKPDLLKEE